MADQINFKTRKVIGNVYCDSKAAKRIRELRMLKWMGDTKELRASENKMQPSSENK